MDKSKRSDIKKLQFAFHPRTAKVLEGLQIERGASTKSEVIRDAISVFLWVHEQGKLGYRILAEKDGHIIEPVWPHIFPHHHGQVIPTLPWAWDCEEALVEKLP